MSGLVPLGVDILRYSESITDSFIDEIYLGRICSQVGANKWKRFRSEIAQQTISFGADIQTK